MEHIRTVTIPLKSAAVEAPSEFGYFIFALLGLMAALTLGVKGQARR